MATRTIPYLSTAPRFSLRSAPRKLWVTAWAMVHARVTRRHLMEMDDRMLADIGLSRSQARQEGRRPFWDLEQLR